MWGNLDSLRKFQGNPIVYGNSRKSKKNELYFVVFANSFANGCFTFIFFKTMVLCAAWLDGGLWFIIWSYIDHTLWQTHAHRHNHLGLIDPLFQGSGIARTFTVEGGGGLDFRWGHKESWRFMSADQWFGRGNKKSSSFTKADPKEKKKSSDIIFV